MTIGQTYRRISPDGDASIWKIENQAAKEYHEHLKEQDFKYYLISYAQESTCVSCES